MKRLFYILGCLLLFTTLNGQDNGYQNPFEIKDRLPASEAQVEDPALEADPYNGNPFEIRTPTTPNATPEVGDVNQGTLLIRRNNEPAVLDARGRTLGIHVLHFFITALLWIFFRPVLARCVQAIYNDGILSQLHRQRESGQGLIFFFSYALFFLSGGFFAYLVGQTFEIFPSDQPWQYTAYLTVLLVAIVLAKHLLLWLIGQLFPIGREIRKYNFAIMVFGIVIGMMLVFVNLLISYAPASTTHLLAWSALILLGSIYFIRSLRGLLIGSRYINGKLLHFLLYICTVEIAPLLYLYRYFGG